MSLYFTSLNRLRELGLRELLDELRQTGMIEIAVAHTFHGIFRVASRIVSIGGRLRERSGSRRRAAPEWYRVTSTSAG